MKEIIKGSNCKLKIVSENGSVLYLTCENIPSTTTENTNTVASITNYLLKNAYTFTLINSNSAHQILFLKLMRSLKNLLLKELIYPVKQQLLKN